MDEKDAPESIASVQKQRFRVVIIQSGIRKEKKKKLISEKKVEKNITNILG